MKGPKRTQKLDNSLLNRQKTINRLGRQFTKSNLDTEIFQINAGDVGCSQKAFETLMANSAVKQFVIKIQIKIQMQVDQHIIEKSKGRALFIHKIKEFIQRQIESKKTQVVAIDSLNKAELQDWQEIGRDECKYGN